LGAAQPLLHVLLHVDYAVQPGGAMWLNPVATLQNLKALNLFLY
jgi:hypothetical protein